MRNPITVLCIIICLFLALFLLIPVVSMIQTGDQGSRGIQFTRGTLYVGQGQTYTKIQDAITAANSGDLIRVYAGTYNEDILLDRTVTLVGNGSQLTHIVGTGAGNTVVFDANWCNMTGFNVSGANPNYSGIRIGYAENNTLTDCRSGPNQYYGISIGNSKNNNIIDCFSYNNSMGMSVSQSYFNTIVNTSSVESEMHGVNSFDSSYNTYDNCHFENNGETGISFGWGAIENIVRNCSFSWNTDGIDFIWLTNYNRVEDCTFLSNTDDGIYLSYAHHNIVQRNVFQSNQKFAIKVVESSQGNLFYHNNFFDNNQGNKQALDSGSGNKWYDIDEGNHWSDWTIPDTEPDGIVDDPYNLGGTAFEKDRYPLTDPFGELKLYVGDNRTPWEDMFYSTNCFARNTPSNIDWFFSTNATWLEFGDLNHTMYGNPHNGHVGRPWVNVTVADGAGGEDIQNFTLTVGNARPWILTKDVVLAYEDSYYFVDYESDDEGQGNITWSLLSDSNWLSMDPGTGILNGTPRNEDVGYTWANVVVDDGNGGKDSSNFTISVYNSNDPPKWTDVPENTTIVEGETYIFDVNATDMDKWDILEYDITSIPSTNIVIEESSGMIRWRPKEVKTFVFKLSATDSKEKIYHEFWIEVLKSNSPPTIIIVSPPPEGAVANNTYNITWMGSDVDPVDMLTVDLYYVNQSQLDSDDKTGNVIALDIPNTGYYIWDINEVLEGEYYIYGVIDDGVATGDDLSEGKLIISHHMRDITPPMVTITDPEDMSVGNSLNPVVSITFNEPMNPGSITSSTLYLSDELGNKVLGEVWYTETPEEHLYTAYLDTYSNLYPAQYYSVTARSSIKDVAGNTLDGNANGITQGSPTDDYLISFRTKVLEEGEADTTPPKVLTTSPLDGAIEVGHEIEITITFSESMDRETLTNSTILMLSETNDYLAGTVSYDEPSQTVTFRPSFPLEFEQMYTLVVTTEVHDLAGNRLDGDRDGISEGSPTDDYRFKFTTSPDDQGGVEEEFPWAAVFIILTLFLVAVIIIIIIAMVVVKKSQLGDYEVRDVFVIYNDGTLLSHCSSGDTLTMDKYTVSSMLTAIKDFVGDSFKDDDEEEEERTLQELKHGELWILVEYGEKIYLALVSRGRVPESVRIRMRGMIRKTEEDYKDILADWDGDEEKVEDMAELIKPLLPGNGYTPPKKKKKTGKKKK
jgi:parallel beta-helix repeat protein